MHVGPNWLKWLPRQRARVIGACLFCLLSGGLHSAIAAKQRSEGATAGSAKPYADPDAYQIYASLLAGKRASSLVIEAETETLRQASPKNLGIKGDSKFMKLWGSALRDLATEYRTPKLLSKNIPLAAAYEMAPDDSLNEIFNKEHEKGWTTFSERYPLAHGYYSFSPVGFNATKTRAIVWMEYSCDGLCGAGGTYHFFEKKEGSWREVSVNAEVIRMAA